MDLKELLLKEEIRRTRSAKSIRPTRTVSVYSLLSIIALSLTLYGISILKRTELAEQVEYLESQVYTPRQFVQAVKFSPYQVLTEIDSCDGLIIQAGDWVGCQSI